MYKDPEPATPEIATTVAATAQAAAGQNAVVAEAATSAAGDAAVATAAVKAETIVAPMAGESVPMETVEDPMFAAKVMGDGCAIRPTEGKVFSPVNGTITVLAETGHAIGLLSDNGCELLLHIGIDTVNLEGKPFAAHVAVGDKVTVGQLLMDVDLNQIKKAGLPTTTMVIITNTDAYSKIASTTGVTVAAGDKLINIE